MSNPIVEIKTSLYQVPLKEVLADAMHGDHHYFELILVDILTKDGIIGTGYTYTGGKGGKAIQTMIEIDLAPQLIGKNANDIEHLNSAMYWMIHYVGRGGISSFAISAIDIALWDIRCKREETSLFKLLGGTTPGCRAYCGGIDLQFSIEKLIRNIEGYLEKGYNAVKIKIGRENWIEDLERIRAVRKTIGPDATFMVDANYSMTVEEAIRAANEMERYNIYWFEEPTNPDDYPGYATIATETNIPLAMGENLHTIYEFQHAMRWANLSYIQPDASNCGGITGWLAVAKLAKKSQLPVCSHGMQELHISLVGSQPHGGWVEIHSFPIDEYTKQPVQVRSFRAQIPDTVGIGVEFDLNKLNPFIH